MTLNDHDTGHKYCKNWRDVYYFEISATFPAIVQNNSTKCEVLTEQVDCTIFSVCL